MTGLGIQGNALAWWYVVGSCFFTSAAYLQYLEAMNAPLGPDYFSSLHAKKKRSWWWFRWTPGHIAFWATFPQFVGTLCFNAFCLCALSIPQPLVLVWLDQWVFPVLGSLLFLTSAVFAILEVSHGLFVFRPRSISWWVVWVNCLGCAGFLAGSALALPGGDPPLLAQVDAWFNFQGGLFFLISSYLMLPEMFSE